MDFTLVEYAGESFWRCENPGPIHGTDGPLYRYAIYIEKGLRLNRGEIVRQIDATLGDVRGWTRGAVRFQRVSHDADTDCLVAKPDTVDELCVPLDTQGEVSCCVGRKVVINIKRWREAVPHWRPGTRGRLQSYRQMVVNHEFGHRIGKDHGYCPGEGQRAPVMQQQTYFLKGCVENPWPLRSELP